MALPKRTYEDIPHNIMGIGRILVESTAVDHYSFYDVVDYARLRIQIAALRDTAHRLEAEAEAKLKAMGDKGCRVMQHNDGWMVVLK